MKRVLSVAGILWVIFWQEGAAMSIKTKAKKSCTVEYRFFNPSLGPVEGERTFRVVLRGDKVLEVVDLRTHTRADPGQGFPGLRIVREVLAGKREGKYRVTYDDKGRPLKVEAASGRAGASYRIDILKQNCIR
ncbi:hypothetical protein [Nitratifractor sp.]